jgi:hypothetical protein
VVRKFPAGQRDILKKVDEKPDLQAAIIRKLVHRIEITSKGFEIDFFVGSEHFRRELGAVVPGSLDLVTASQGCDAGQSETTKTFFCIGGSRRLTNGGGKRSWP